MQVEDDLKLHSHCISELYEKEKVQRERLHAMKEEQLLHSHIIKQSSENIVEAAKNVKECQGLWIQVKTDLDIFKKEFLSKKSGWEIALDYFKHPKNWIPLLILVTLIDSVKSFHIVDVVKYYTGV